MIEVCFVQPKAAPESQPSSIKIKHRRKNHVTKVFELPLWAAKNKHKWASARYRSVYCNGKESSGLGFRPGFLI
jgi:hypothetical protein